jgi:ubiquinone biosynthesis monooxygenase Coq7
MIETVAQPMAGNDIGDRIVKVNHAGEHGAVCIYSGQIFAARFTARRLVKELVEFRCHEQRHRAVFWAELQRRGKPRCHSYLLCGFGGYVLGLITGFLGAGAVAATTVAVERVVLRHLEQQLCVLGGIDPAAVSAILSIVSEEREHHARSSAHLKAGNVWATVLTPIVSASTEAVIWLGMRR